MIDDAEYGRQRTEDGARIDDTELLRRYAGHRDEAAFAELVQRHVNLVHSIALRQVNGDAHLAADVTQLVFTDLARKAGALVSHRVLAGWLFTSTRFAAAKLVRGEQRRHVREQEAQLMQELTRDPAAALDWERVRPVLDDVLGELNDTDREAILLRFFEGRDFATVGAKLNVNDNTARMRVERALEKLRGLLERRGVSSTSAALAAVLANQAVVAAPAGLAAAVTGAALAHGGAAALATGAAATAAGAGVAAAASGSGGGLIGTFMAMTKLQLGISAALAVAGTTGFVLQAQSNTSLRDEAAALRQQNGALARLHAENQKLARTHAEVADMRGDDAELKRLADESAALKTRLRQVARAEEQRRVAAADMTKMRGMEVFDISKLDQQPRPKFQARPQYPFELRRAGVGGQVVVDFIVDQQGTVQNAYPIKSSLDENAAALLKGMSTEDARKALEIAAVDSVSQWKFAAGRKGGRDVNTHMQVPIVFTLSSKPAGTAPKN